MRETCIHGVPTFHSLVYSTMTRRIGEEGDDGEKRGKGEKVMGNGGRDNGKKGRYLKRMMERGVEIVVRGA